MKLTVTPLADAGVVVLPFDILWSRTVGDVAITASSEEGAAGGLVAAHPLRTAVILLLFTDGRAETTDIRFEHAGDRRGWPGDGFDVDRTRGEVPLGSKLWLYRRHELNDDTGRQVAAEAYRALEPLIRQGAVARIDTACDVDKPAGALRLRINLYGRDGREAYAANFDLLWRRADGGL